MGLYRSRENVLHVASPRGVCPRRLVGSFWLVCTRPRARRQKGAWGRAMPRSARLSPGLCISGSLCECCMPTPEFATGLGDFRIEVCAVYVHTSLGLVNAFCYYGSRRCGHTHVVLLSHPMADIVRLPSTTTIMWRRIVLIEPPVEHRGMYRRSCVAETYLSSFSPFT